MSITLFWKLTGLRVKLFSVHTFFHFFLLLLHCLFCWLLWWGWDWKRPNTNGKLSMILPWISSHITCERRFKIVFQLRTECVHIISIWGEGGGMEKFTNKRSNISSCAWQNVVAANFTCVWQRCCYRQMDVRVGLITNIRSAIRSKVPTNDSSAMRTTIYGNFILSYNFFKPLGSERVFAQKELLRKLASKKRPGY